MFKKNVETKIRIVLIQFQKLKTTFLVGHFYVSICKNLSLIFNYEDCVRSIIIDYIEIYLTFISIDKYNNCTYRKLICHSYNVQLCFPNLYFDISPYMYVIVFFIGKTLY